MNRRHFLLGGLASVGLLGSSKPTLGGGRSPDEATDSGMTIHDAYAIYKRITCDYEDFDRIPDIFTDDFVGGNASLGEIRGLEAQTLFLRAPYEMGSPPEEHLWCMIDGDNLAFRARNWEGEKGDSDFFDLIGHLIFDPRIAKFRFYYGFYDPMIPAKMLLTNRPGSLWTGLEQLGAIRDATEQFESIRPAGV